MSLHRERPSLSNKRFNWSDQEIEDLNEYKQTLYQLIDASLISVAQARRFLYKAVTHTLKHRHEELPPDLATREPVETIDIGWVFTQKLTDPYSAYVLYLIEQEGSWKAAAKKLGVSYQALQKQFRKRNR